MGRWYDPAEQMAFERVLDRIQAIIFSRFIGRLMIKLAVSELFLLFPIFLSWSPSLSLVPGFPWDQDSLLSKASARSVEADNSNSNIVRAVPLQPHDVDLTEDIWSSRRLLHSHVLFMCLFLISDLLQFFMILGIIMLNDPGRKFRNRVRLLFSIFSYGTANVRNENSKLHNARMMKCKLLVIVTAILTMTRRWALPFYGANIYAPAEGQFNISEDVKAHVGDQRWRELSFDLELREICGGM